MDGEMSKNGFSFAGIQPSRDGLLIALRPCLTDDLIVEMAKSDVDIPKEVAANLNALTAIRDTALVPGELPWNPAEVCNLMRWEKKKDEKHAVMKIFASWILIRAYTQVESKRSGLVYDGDEHAIIALVEGALDINGVFPMHAAGFLSWAYQELLHTRLYRDTSQYRNQARPFYAFGLLMTVALMKTSAIEDGFKIATLLNTEEIRVRKFVSNDLYIAQSRDFTIWLLGLVGDDLNNFQSRCQALVQRIRDSKRSNENGMSKILDEILERWKSIGT